MFDVHIGLPGGAGGQPLFSQGSFQGSAGPLVVQLSGLVLVLFHEGIAAELVQFGVFLAIDDHRADAGAKEQTE